MFRGAVHSAPQNYKTRYKEQQQWSFSTIDYNQGFNNSHLELYIDFFFIVLTLLYS